MIVQCRIPSSMKQDVSCRLAGQGRNCKMIDIMPWGHGRHMYVVLSRLRWQLSFIHVCQNLLQDLQFQVSHQSHMYERCCREALCWSIPWPWWQLMLSSSGLCCHNELQRSLATVGIPAQQALILLMRLIQPVVLL